MPDALHRLRRDAVRGFAARDRAERRLSWLAFGAATLGAGVLMLLPPAG